VCTYVCMYVYIATWRRSEGSTSSIIDGCTHRIQLSTRAVEVNILHLVS
jgi:hypothetical protein